MTTELLYQADAYLKEAEARVLETTEAGVVLDRTVFYPQGGGQPGDAGLLIGASSEIPVVNVLYAKDRSTVLHIFGEGAPRPEAGQTVRARIDWPVRLRRMRIHTALHLLSVVLPYPVTGGAIGDGEGRLDFALPEAPPDRQEIETRLQALIDEDAPVSTRWITDEELLANPGLVKTMSVTPPMGSGRVRLVAIGTIDLQPCGGTHVAQTGEIGRIGVTGIENKGKQNRRVRIALA
ncbi:MAG TPA: alanyl-tRNA editing protein [Lichenihabitans sp.]|jgi:misacylated tRNA(Ala) deacylase|nr:alanyl-tRNA editing protein [Lichenihabitans sp.]